MKIIGKTLGGDLIIQVSRAEWDGLQDGVRPEDDVWVLRQRWEESEAGKFLVEVKYRYGRAALWRAFRFNQIDGSIQSLRDLADGKPRLNYIGAKTRTKLKSLLDERRVQSGDEG